jgi:phosphoenolpyruvate synthase/pyruvate phosphate dikinase
MTTCLLISPSAYHRGFAGQTSIQHQSLARAAFEAAAEVQKAGIKVKPEVMIPLVGFKRELDLQVAVVHAAAKAVMAEKKVKLNYMVGTMIEVPRGALTDDEIVQKAGLPRQDQFQQEHPRFNRFAAGVGVIRSSGSPS